MKPKFNLYVIVTVLLAITTTLIMVKYQFPLPKPTEKVIIGLEAFFILSLLVEIFSIPLISSQVTVSVVHPVLWAMIVLFGPFYATIIAAITGFIYDFQVKKDDYQRILASVSQQIIAVSLAGMVYLWTGGVVGQQQLRIIILPFLISVSVYFVVNSILASCLIAFTEGMSPRDAWEINFRWMVPNEIALVPFSILMVFIYQFLDIMGIMLFLIPLLMMRRSYSLNIDLKKTYKETVQAFVKTIEAHDSYTSGHSIRVAQYCKMMAKALKLPYYEFEKLEIAAYLHDLGKIAANFSTNILNHQGKLNEDEKRNKNVHLHASDKLISSITVLKDIGEIVRYHHERFDGTGYPEGLKGEQIPLPSRILMVADAFDAMTSDRPYRKALSIEEAVRELKDNAGSQFDPDLVKLFLERCINHEDYKNNTNGKVEEVKNISKMTLTRLAK